MNQDQNQNQNPYQNQSYPSGNTYGQMPGEGTGQAPGWNQPPGYPSGYGQPVQRGPQGGQGEGVFPLVSLVLGIMSIVLCCVFGGIFGIAGLVFGIISCVRHEEKRGMAIGGIITSAVGIVLFIFVIVLHFVMLRGFTDYLLENYEAELNMGAEGYFAEAEDKDLFAGNRFVVGDDVSVMEFGEDQSVLCYLVDDTDSYVQGTYTAYHGEAAVEVLIQLAAEYGITEDVDEYFSQNTDGIIHTRENFTVLILRMDTGRLDGEDWNLEPYDETYMGFFTEEYGYYDAECMDHGEDVLFVLK